VSEDKGTKIFKNINEIKTSITRVVEFEPSSESLFDLSRCHMFCVKLGDVLRVQQA
jgi:hypothetical protein